MATNSAQEETAPAATSLAKRAAELSIKLAAPDYVEGSEPEKGWAWKGEHYLRDWGQSAYDKGTDDGLRRGTADTHNNYTENMLMGGWGGGAAGLLYEALRKKTDEEKKQQTGQKILRYLRSGGIGAGLGVAGGSLLTNIKASASTKGNTTTEENKKTASALSALQAFIRNNKHIMLGGAGLGGLYGAITAPRGKLLRGALRGSAIGGAAGTGLGLGANATDYALDSGHTPMTGLGAAGGGLLSALLTKRVFDEYAPMQKDDKQENTSMEENKKAASENLSLAARAAALSIKLAEEEKKEEPKAESGDDEAKTRRRGAAKARAKDLVNTSSFGGGVGDYFFPGMWGGHRAGRATQISQALGQKPSFNLRHPLTSDFLAMLGGGLGGAALGGGLGGLAGAMSGNDAGAPAALGALLGAGIGGVAAPFATRGARRGEMDRVRNSLEDELANNGGANIKPVSPNFGVLSSIFLPAAGAHRAGQADAYQALKNNERYAPGTGRNLAYMADMGSGLLGPFGAPVPLVRGWAQNFNARGRTAESKPRQAERYGLNEFAPRDPDADLQALPKAASLRKTAKVYEAAEPVDGMQPKKTYESHKKCAPGEFGMNKEGGANGGFSISIPNPNGKSLEIGAHAGSGALMGGGVGALLGGAAGAINPGDESVYDNEGNVVGRRRKSRLAAALKGVLGGGMLGALGGGAGGALSDIWHQTPADQRPSLKTGSAREFGFKVALDLPMGFKGTDLIAPALGAGVGALGGAVLGKKKEKLRSALIGAGLGAGAGGLAEHFAPGLGLGAKYVGQDIGAHLTGNAGTWSKGFKDLGRAPEIIGEMVRRKSLLPGLRTVGNMWHGG